jgi:hypothetical protein
LRTRAAVRSGCAFAGVLIGVVVLAAAGTTVKGLSAGPLLVPAIALVGGILLQRSQRATLRGRLDAIGDLPTGAKPLERGPGRMVMAIYAAAIAVITIVLGFAADDAADIAYLVLGVTLAFTFGDLLDARAVEVLEQSRALVVYSPQVGGASKRAGAGASQLYAVRRR